ncbi:MULTISPECIES: TRAP transporter substrate-binding protein [Oceanobacillus]|uniref:TRAP transporter substrate-binding protein n=1 Tax=Oceanobacillus TaxID=182709 RepID=UPI0030F76683
MKKLIFTSLIVLILGILSACGGSNNETSGDGGSTSESGETLKLRAATGSVQDHSSYKGLEKFKEIVEEKAEGAIEVELYHSGQLGDDRAMTEAVQLGTQEMAIVSVGNVTPFVPESAIVEFPFIFPSNEVAYEVLDGPAGQKILDKFPEKNMIGLGFWENGFRNVTSNVQQIETAEDFEGLKLRTMSNDVHIDAFKALGANPTPMAFTELYTGLQQGAVDGQENPYPLIYLNKFFEVQKYMSDTQHVYSPYLVLLSKNFYDQLTEEQQGIVKEAAIEAGKYQREVNQEQVQEYLQEIIDSGKIEFTEVSEEARNEMKELVQPVIDQHSDVVGEDIVDAIYDAVEKASK